jgi:hypothetical protein
VYHIVGRALGIELGANVGAVGAGDWNPVGAMVGGEIGDAEHLAA